MKRLVTTGPVLALAAAACLGLAGCQTGSTAQTSQQYDPTDGRNVNQPADATYGDPYIAIRGAQLVDLDGSKSVVLTLVNKTDEVEVLQSIAVDGELAEMSEASVELPVGEPVNVGEVGEVTALVDAPDVAAGDWATLTLTFGSAGVSEFDVLTVTAPDFVAGS